MATKGKGKPLMLWGEMIMLTMVAGPHTPTRPLIPHTTYPTTSDTIAVSGREIVITERSRPITITTSATATTGTETMFPNLTTDGA